MLKFKRNMGKLDRTVRIVVGTLLIILGPVSNIFELPTTLVIILGVLGSIAILSAIFSYCLLYEFTGSDTSR